MIGVLVNFLGVVLGGFMGCLLKNGMSEKINFAVSKGVALCVLVIGIMGAITTSDQLLMIVCIVIGTLIGELIGIEKGIEKMGDFAQKKLHGQGGFSEGFVSATLLFCVGSMAVVGSLDAGFSNDASTLLAKSALDAVSAVMFASSFGAGVMLSAVPLTIYQGGIALLAVWIKPYLGPEIIGEMKAVGSVLIIALGINLLDLMNGKKLRVANMLPSMFLPIAYIPIYNWIMTLIR
ncbi:MAG: DUF554 domain-containing protein [Clostridia bacterium]|nr:DUF554 domain-containing protein [Clostridia bacterium]